MRILISISALLIIFLTGCGSVEDTLYLQSIEVSTPLNIPPLNIISDANKDKVTISPKLYINDVRQVEGTHNHSLVNQLGEFEIDTVDNRLISSPNNRYNYSGRNLKWNIPDVFAGIDIDLPVGKSVAINGGLNVSSESGTELFGGTLGLSAFVLSDNSAFRFSGGFTLQQFRYEAQTVVRRVYSSTFLEDREEIFLFKDINKESELNFYLSILYNSNFPEFPFNFYFGISYFRQTLFDFEPSSPEIQFTPFFVYTSVDARGEYTAGFFNLAPGLFKDISDWGRVVGGVNFVLGNSITNATETSFMLPFMKFELFL